MKRELPIACTLSEQELRFRQESLIRELTTLAQEITALDAGYKLRFAPDGGLLPRLAEFVEQERQCCPFLQFTMTVEPATGPIHLTITGPEGINAFLENAFQLSEGR
jgi:hypothetical protein